MANILIKILSWILFWIIFKVYQILNLVRNLYRWAKNYVRKMLLKSHFASDTDLIVEEIKPKINKKMQHVALCWMESLDQNTERQLNNLWTLLDWLRLWDVKYLTLYIDNMGNISTTQMEKFMINALNQQFDSGVITWVTDDQKHESPAMSINILTSTDASRDLCENMQQFWSEDSYTDQSSDMRTSNYQVIDYLKDNLQMYQPMRKLSKRIIDDSKTYFEDHNPDLTLLFNQKDFTLGNFPPLMREFSEMLQCGSLRKMNILCFYDAMTKFFDIQQRWGI